MSIFEIRSSWDWLGITRDTRMGRSCPLRGRMVGLRLRDMDSVVGTSLTIERQIKDTWNTRDTGVGSKR